MVQTGVIVAALLALGAGGALNPASAQQDCGAPDKEVGYSEEEEVMSSNAERSSLWSEGYVQPGRDFRGISVRVNQGNVQHVAWFPADSCFPDTEAKWDWVKVKVTKNGQGMPPSSNHCYLRFDLVTTYCKKNCNRYDTVSCQSLGNLSVAARGPSNWKTDHPEISCLVKMVSRPSPPPVYICKNPPFSPPPNTAEMTSTATATDPFPSSASSASSSSSVVMLIVVSVVAVVVFLVIVVVVVVVMVVVCSRGRRRRSVASRMGIQYHYQLHPPTPTQNYVIENNPYEPLGGSVNPTRGSDD